jgi:hypothetical protein
MVKKILWSAGFTGLCLFGLALALQMPSHRSACSNGADWLACLHGAAGSQARLELDRYN